MEQQKILWVIFSVALFSVIVVVLALVWLRPPATEAGTATATAGNTLSFDTLDILRGTEEAPEPDVIPATEENIEVLPPDEPEQLGVNNQAENSILPEGTAEPEVAFTNGAEMREQQTAMEKAANTVKEEPRTSREEPTPVAAVKAEPKEQPKQLVTEYWIQLASLSKMSQAEQMQQGLSESGVTTRIFTKEVEGIDYFRLRNGPYSNKAEADKFLAWIKGLDGYSTSYISEVKVYR